MKLLLDGNLSFRLVKLLNKSFPEIEHVYNLGLSKKTDIEIWDYATIHDYIIVTKDSDFYERSLLYGVPPKIIWLKTGNCNTEKIFEIINLNKKNIELFNDSSEACLILY